MKILAYILLASLALTPAAAQKKQLEKNATARKAAAPARSPQQKFALDVVRMAVALPQPDPQDRLRVLNSAMAVSGPLDRRLSKGFAKEGARIESELIAIGQTPAVSVMSSGQVDCATAQNFVEQLNPETVVPAEQSIIGAVTSCPAQTAETARARVEAALKQRRIAPRAVLALMDHFGPKNAWSQEVFAQLFSSLPNDGPAARKEAPNFAAMFLQMAPQVEKATAKRAGLEFLEWLGKLPESGERNLAVNMTTDALREILGAEDYEAALATNVMARQTAHTAGEPGEVEQQEHESASVLSAMGSVGKDQTASLQEMPASKRAREAAAHGFASGTGGDKPAAVRYFDIAFDAVNEVWNNRTPETNAPAVVEEVSEAAAQVDAVAALHRARQLQDPSAQAISMLAVARVVLGQQNR